MILIYKNKTILFALGLLLICSPLGAQRLLTLSGFVTSESDGESLIGASVYMSDLRVGTITNEYGFYSLTVASGQHDIEYSYIGYTSINNTIDLSENRKRDIELNETALELEAVVITSEAEDKNVSDLQMSVNKLDMLTIQKMPTLLGEVEILRSIQFLPGVTSVGEGASGFNVRGGSIDQNLVLLDEAPVFNSSHLFGFFSVFNPDAVKDVKLYKGGIPARYGGRLSSILDVRMKEGNNKRFAAQGGIGFIFSRLAIEAPIIKDKASFIVAGRRSYIDVLSRPFLNDDLKDSRLNFYDLTLKTNYDINENNKLFLSGYFGRDNFVFGDDAGFNWGNSTGTLRWNHLFSEKLFSNLTFYYSNYDYQINFGEDALNRFDWDARIINYSIKPEFALYLNPSNILRFGGQAIAYNIEPGNAVGISEGEARDISLAPQYALEGGHYIENELTFANSLTINYGARWSYFNYTGEGVAHTFGEAEPGTRRPVLSSESFDQWESIATYNNIEPRFSVKYQLGNQQSVKASYNRTVQYLHLISNTTASTPLDIWSPSTNNLEPQTADQLALGYFRNFSNNTYEFSVEGYYKRLNHLVDYIDGADLIFNEFLEGDLLEGKGRAYGLELLLKKEKGRFSGWASYTLARTERLVNGVNRNDWYPSRFDQTHNLSLSSFYELGERWSLSANFVLNSGTPTTFADTRFEQQGYVIPNNRADGRNNVRIPLYHRLDFAATLQGKNNNTRRWKSKWIFSIYNIYSRRNPFSIYFQQEDTRLSVGTPINTEAVQLSIIGNFIPSVSYNFEF